MLSGFSTILTAAAALAAVIGLIFLAAHFARASPLPRRGGGILTAREVLPLDQGRRLHLVRCEGRAFLLLTGGPRDLLIGWLPEREPTEREPTP